MTQKKERLGTKSIDGQIIIRKNSISVFFPPKTTAGVFRRICMSCTHDCSSGGGSWDAANEICTQHRTISAIYATKFQARNATPELHLNFWSVQGCTCMSCVCVSTCKTNAKVIAVVDCCCHRPGPGRPGILVHVHCARVKSTEPRSIVFTFPQWQRKRSRWCNLLLFYFILFYFPPTFHHFSVRTKVYLLAWNVRSDDSNLAGHKGSQRRWDKDNNATRQRKQIAVQFRWWYQANPRTRRRILTTRRDINNLDDGFIQNQRDAPLYSKLQNDSAARPIVLSNIFPDFCRGCKKLVFFQIFKIREKSFQKFDLSLNRGAK